jgi:hypothetical protein
VPERQRSGGVGDALGGQNAEPRTTGKSVPLGMIEHQIAQSGCGGPQNFSWYLKGARYLLRSLERNSRPNERVAEVSACVRKAQQTDCRSPAFSVTRYPPSAETCHRAGDCCVTLDLTDKGRTSQDPSQSKEDHDWRNGEMIRGPVFCTSAPG